jgi:uncharacterized membrane protein
MLFMPDIHVFFISAGLSILPISELRGAIPYALANQMPLWLAFIYCVGWNALVGPIVYIFLGTVHKLLYRIGFYRRFFDRFIERTRNKVKDKVEKYGYLGLAIFVGIPLPVTGAYTGTLGAFILGMDRKKALLSVALGVLIAGIIVSIVSFFGIEALSLFTKQITV